MDTASPREEALAVEANYSKTIKSRDDVQLTDVAEYMKKNYHFTDRFIYRNGGEIIIGNVVTFAIIHVAVAYAAYVAFAEGLQYLFVYVWSLNFIHGLGVTAGSHRLFTHKSYKAKLPLRIYLMLVQASVGQKDMHNWVRDHRVHHKFSETDADPHNSKRGWFFAHMGWLMVKKHPDVRLKGQVIDCSDILDDPVIQFQMKHYYKLFLLLGVLLPVAAPMYLWGISLSRSFLICFLLRWTFLTHGTWFVNSAAHVLGDRPYDTTMAPRENVMVSIFAGGEGFHNYHHSFPWDYSTSEYLYYFNMTTMFIDLMAWLGQAYDLKRASAEVVAKKREKVTQMTRKEMDNGTEY